MNFSAMQSPDKKTVELAVGGEFHAMGILERELLIQHGLQPSDYVIDIGCGSGRLAKPLSEYLVGKYLGTDISLELLNHATKIVARPAWRFEIVTGCTIPELDAQANMVCFFSVFTHLPHHQSYAYLQEAMRVLRPGGKVIFSFLEFRLAAHWYIFEAIVQRQGVGQLDQFISRDGIQAWASHLGFKIELLQDGDRPHITLRHAVTREDGSIMKEKGMLGQSVCVLIKHG